MAVAYALIHSPLVGPETWEPVAEALRWGGREAWVPGLPAVVDTARPYWAQHAEAVARQVNDLAAVSEGLVLVAHSGAGALLPAIRQALGRAVQGYVFVDAGLPAPGQSRLESFGEGAAAFRAHLAGGERFPTWTDDDLKESVPDTELRARLIADLRPQPRAYWEEPLPEISGWPDAPGAYLLFSPVYAEAAQQARERGWPVRVMPGGHFHMLVMPGAVAEAIKWLVVSG